MYLILASADTAYNHGLSNTYFDTQSIDSSLPDHRRRSLIASRFLLCHASMHFYNKKVQIDFDKGQHGKPFFKGQGLFFNLSHSGSYIALCLSLQTQCGVDIENLKERKSLSDLAKRVLSVKELEFFNSLAEPDAIVFFYRMWTVRECLIKQSGLGLVGLDGIKCHIDNNSIVSKANPKGRVISMLVSNAKDKYSRYSLSCFYKDNEPELYSFDGSFSSLCVDHRQYYTVNS